MALGPLAFWSTVASIAVEAVMAVHFWRARERIRGGRWLVAAVVAALGGAVGLLGQLLSDSLAGAVFWSHVTAVFGLPALLAIFAFAAVYTRRAWVLRSRPFAALAGALAVLFAVRLTNDLPGSPGFHNLYATAASTDLVGGYRIIEVTWGPAAPVYNLLIAIALLVMIAFGVEFTLRPSQRLYRRQNAVVSIAFALPAVTSIVGQAFGAAFEPTVPAVAISLVLVAAALSRFGVLEVVPIARTGVVDEIDGGVIVFDDRERVIDVTERARDVLGIDDRGLGDRLGDLLVERLGGLDPDGPPITEQLDDATFRLAGDPECFLETRVSTLTSRDGAELSRALLVYDVTDRERRKRALETERDARKALQDALARTSSIESFAGAACEQVAALESVAFAWVGTVGPNGGLEPLADVDAGAYFEGLDLGPDADGTVPGVEAVRSGEPVARTVDADDGAWAERAGARGANAVLAVPIAHDGVVRGVLSVHRRDGNEVDRVGELCREVADVLGYALGSAERRRALTAGDRVEVTFAVDAGGPVTETCRASGTAGRVVATVPRDEETALTYLDLAAADVDAFVEAASERQDVTAVDRLDGTGGERGGVQLLVEGPTPDAVVAEHGGDIREATAGPDGAEVTARFPRGTNFEPVLSALAATVGEARVEHYTSDPPDHDAEDELLAGLTDRQREVLEVAFRAGYYAYPREQSAAEVAERLGVSRASFQEVRQAAERNLLERAFDRE